MLKICLMQLHAGSCHVLSAEIAVAMAVPIENPADWGARCYSFPACRWNLWLSCRRAKLSCGIVLLHDNNTRPHTARQTQASLLEQFHWDIFEHPPYSPDLGSSDVLLFLKMKHLAGKRFANDENLKNSGGGPMVWWRYKQTGATVGQVL